MSTAVGDNSKRLEVKEFSYEVVSTAVDFMYGIEIPEDFNSDDLKSLLHMADLFLMEGLKDAAGIRIEISKDNVFDTSQLADKFRAVSLSERCAEFLFDNATIIEDEKPDEIKEGTVMASLVKRFVMESKRLQRKDSWVSKLFGEWPDLKRQEDFGSVEDYTDYVKSTIMPKMFVSCNKSSGWSGYTINEGHVGIVTSTGHSSYVQVMWLTLEAGDPAYDYLNNKASIGSFECLDLLTSPFKFAADLRF
jgi:hypothetical protein